ncbi:hypothetical protein FRC01_000380 [Tulasnella sp. 417]|nr:hypothetical protein FRC01_000380 [Tulasnella sp. 417]
MAPALTAATVNLPPLLSFRSIHDLPQGLYTHPRSETLSTSIYAIERMDTSSDEHRQLQQDCGLPPPPAPQPLAPFTDFDFTFTPEPIPQMSSFAEFQESSFSVFVRDDAASILDFNFGSAASHGGGDLHGGGGPPRSGGIPPLLLISAEETSLLVFLDKFSGYGFEFGPVKGMPEYPKHLGPPAGGIEIASGQGGTNASHYRGLGLEPPPPSSSSIPVQRASSPAEVDPSPRPSKRRKSSVTDSSSKDADAPPPTPSASSSKAARKTLLTEPQKRWNHIQSEQRRRTVIKENRDQGELQHARNARRGRQEEVKAKSLRGKGKMGALFRAAEFIAYLEEGVGALSLEVEWLEAAAATYQQQQHHQMQGQNAMTGVVHYPLR